MRFRKLFRFSLTFAAVASFACPQEASAPQSDGALERVLTQMDNTAAKFHTTQASFVWNQYSKVVDETDTQKGKVYFRRANNEIQMAADITDPEKKYVLFNDRKVQVYQPKIEQVTVYNTGKNREAFESFLVLGFGGGGHDMLKSFEVDRKSTRLNSSHLVISYAVFCLKKKKKENCTYYGVVM